VSIIYYRNSIIERAERSLLVGWAWVIDRRVAGIGWFGRAFSGVALRAEEKSKKASGGRMGHLEGVLSL